MTEEEIELAEEIAKRAIEELGDTTLASVDEGWIFCRLSMVLRREKLNLQKLLDFEKVHFIHDVCGILTHINEKGGFDNCFWPRCGSVQEEQKRSKN
jgi:hypothetical protein